MNKRLFWGVTGSAVLVLLAGLVVLFGNGEPAAAQTAVSPAAAPVPTGLNLSSPHMSSANFVLDWNVVSYGGGAAESANFKLNSTIGQPMIGESGSASFQQHRAGFWQRVLITFRNYLPAVLKDA